MTGPGGGGGAVSERCSKRSAMSAVDWSALMSALIRQTRMWKEEKGRIDPPPIGLEWMG